MMSEHETLRIEELIAELPPPLQLQVRDFVEFLLNKQRRQLIEKRGRLRQDWANAINYQAHTSVELQHLAQSWREQ